jgi:hypothetical protein
MKNECGKMRGVNEPYEVWQSYAGDWEYRILKKYQCPDKEKSNPFARWFTAVKTPYTQPRYDLGDTYISEIKKNAYKVENPVIDKW